MTQLRHLSFHGSRGDRGPTTWSQREQWHTLEANRPHDSRFRLRLLSPLPDGIPLGRVLDVLRALVERHETLRTQFVRHPDGPPTQVVHQQGRVPVRVVPVGEAFGPADALAYAGEQLSRDYDPTAEYPARLGVFLRHGRPAFIAGTISHLAVDMTALRVLERDFRALLAADGGDLPAPSHRPLDQARYEQSPEGQAVLARALEAWRSGLDRAPRALFVSPVGPVTGDRYPAFNLYCRGLGDRARRLATALDVDVSAIFVAAAATLLGRAAGVDRFALTLTCANRTSLRLLDYVGTIAQQGVLPVESVATPFRLLVQRMWAAMQTVHRSSVWDPADLDTVLAKATGERDATIDHYVNFLHETTPIAFPAAAGGVRDGEHFCQADEPVPSTLLRFGLLLRTDGQDAVVRMFGDLRYLTQDTLTLVITGIHDLIAGAAAEVAA